MLSVDLDFVLLSPSNGYLRRQNFWKSKRIFLFYSSQLLLLVLMNDRGLSKLQGKTCVPLMSLWVYSLFRPNNVWCDLHMADWPSSLMLHSERTEPVDMMSTVSLQGGCVHPLCVFTLLLGRVPKLVMVRTSNGNYMPSSGTYGMCSWQTDPREAPIILTSWCSCTIYPLFLGFGRTHDCFLTIKYDKKERILLIKFCLCVFLVITKYEGLSSS